jgi:hypothetical protein
MTKKEKETKRLRKLYRELGYYKFMPFGGFRKLANSRKSLAKACK